jgi:RNA polymerase sigma-70 factor (ECF subfamily)
VEDGELIERAAGGDVGAFEVLVARHQGVALRVAHGIAGPDAEDVVQEAFVKAFRALPRFRPGSPFRPWVLRIVANEARNARRRGTRQEQLRVRAGSQAVTTVAATPEEAAESEHDRRRLADAVASLSGTDREVIALRWFAGLSEAEMAVALGCRPGTVKSRLSRAHDRLREVLR